MVARFFGFEGTDSVFGSIANAFMSVVNAVKNAVNAVLTTITNVFNSTVQESKITFHSQQMSWEYLISLLI